MKFLSRKNIQISEKNNNNDNNKIIKLEYIKGNLVNNN